MSIQNNNPNDPPIPPNYWAKIEHLSSVRSTESHSTSNRLRIERIFESIEFMNHSIQK